LRAATSYFRAGSSGPRVNTKKNLAIVYPSDDFNRKIEGEFLGFAGGPWAMGSSGPWIRLSSLTFLGALRRSRPTDSLFLYTLKRRKRKELLTTETELKAMAAEARMGLSNIPQKG
jgi:hypothetical protein